MAQRVTAECVAAEKNDVEGEHDRAEADAEMFLAGARISEPHRLVGVAGKNHQEDERDVEEVAMDVLQNERQIALTAVALARLTDSAVGRVGPEALVVRPPIVVARQPKSGRKRQDYQRGRERYEAG